MSRRHAPLPRTHNGFGLSRTYGLGCSAFARHYSRSRILLSFPRGTEMFQFPRLASRTYEFSPGLPGFARQGFPIRRSTVTLASSQPWLIAGSHVLHRLLVPRHSPHTLSSLAKKPIASGPKAVRVRVLKTLLTKDTFDVTLAFNCQRS